MNAVEMIDALRAEASGAIAAPSYWTDIAPITDTISDLDFYAAGLEFRLSPGDATVDMAFHTTRHDASRNVLAGTAPRRGGTWEGVARFCREWSDPASRLHSRISGLWLEFDDAQRTHRHPTPNVWPGDFDSPRAYELAERCLELMQGAPVAQGVAQRVRKAFRAVAPRYRTRAFGMMLCRDPQQLKLEAVCSADMDLEPLVDSLDASMPEAEMRMLMEAIRRLRSRNPCQMVGIQVQVDESPRIVGVGLNVVPVHLGPDAVLDALRELMALDEAKCDALRQWRGTVGRFEKLVGHVKVGYKSGEGFLAKGYFGVVDPDRAKPVRAASKAIRDLKPRFSLSVLPLGCGHGSCGST